MTSTPKKRLSETGPGGRPKHEVWGLGFRRVLKHCDKSQRTIHAAFCIICSKILCNTASKRLLAHRRICNLDQNEESEVYEKSNSDGKLVMQRRICFEQADDSELLAKSHSDSKIGISKRKYSVEQSDDMEIMTNTDSKLKEITKILSPDNTGTITFVDCMEDGSQFVNDQSSSDHIIKTEYTFIDSPSDDYQDYKLAAAAGTSVQNHKLDLTFAKFFIGCNIPFSVAESSYFKKLCLALNPNCKLVSTEQLSGNLLNSVYSKFHKDMNVSPTSVLLIDGWKNENTNTKNVTVMIKTESNETIFLDNYELSSSKEIVQELTDILKMSILEASEQFKTEVYAVIMGNSCSLIEMDDISEVWQFPCNSHVVKLLTKEFISQDFMNTVCKILKQLNLVFKDDDLDNKISSEMRWISTKCILEYCITNIGTIQTVLSTENLVKLSKDYKCLFFDEDFIRKIEHYINFLESISELTAVSQMPKSSIADAAEQWLSIQLLDDDPDFADKLAAHRDSVVKIQCLVANYLHPEYKGRKLTDDQMNKVEEFLLNELDSEGLNSLQMYLNGEGIFRTLNQKEGLSAQTYWSLARRTNQNLALLALKLHVIPASITSNFSQVFNTVKNTSLKPDKLRKLFAVYYYLKEREERLEIE